MKQHIDKRPITDTLETNYMPYAMSVIVSRAIPEIDGFKPSHRKLLYTMYKMGLLTGGRTKSANVVGQTMKLNPHGDSAIYETMVRLTRGYQALIHPYVDSKGSFGKQYSRDMAYAAARYTEVKLDKICELLFREIDLDTVDFVDNYDATLKEPMLLPAVFPNILVNPNQGIAVGMASYICSFNLGEVCRTTAALIENPDHDLLTTLLAPDFSTGGYLLFNKNELEEIYKTGRGSFKMRARYLYDKKNNCIEVTEIPYSTTVEAIIDKTVELVKGGKIKDIADIRDETDLSGLKLTIDLKRGVDPERLMAALFKMTPLQDTVSCNFNLLIGGSPVVLGVREILTEWTAWRVECIKRRLHFDIGKKKGRLHLLYGLRKILLDIDRAIAIVRSTDEDSEVVPNLMIGFGIDEAQAEYIAEIKLRNLNRSYIINAIADIEKLEKEIEGLEETLNSRRKIERLIIKELGEVEKRFATERKSEILYEDEVIEPSPEELIDDYAVNLFLTKEGYFKKISPLSLRMGGEQRLKDGDEIVWWAEGTNRQELLVFTDQAQVYKIRLHEIDDHKASVLGDFLPARLSMDEGERPIGVAVTGDYEGYMVFIFKNGRAARVSLESYKTKTNRKKLTGAYCAKFPLAGLFQMKEDGELCLFSQNGRVLVFHSGSVPVKSARGTQGVIVMTLSGKNSVDRAVLASDSGLKNPGAYRAKNLPSAGIRLKKEDGDPDQIRLI